MKKRKQKSIEERDKQTENILVACAVISIFIAIIVAYFFIMVNLAFFGFFDWLVEILNKL